MAWSVSEGRSAAALDGRGVERQHWEIAAVAEGGLYSPVLERQGVLPSAGVGECPTKPRPGGMRS
jgi:hypothetical protein